MNTRHPLRVVAAVLAAAVLLLGALIGMELSATALPPQTGALAELEAGLRRRFDPRGLFSDTAVAAWA